jgi:endonuclease/exonuclease/phosphatase family metal-dependent hydrolase
LLLLAIRGRGHVGVAPSLGRDGMWLTAGILAHFGLVFVYYATSGNPVSLFVAIGLLGVGASLASARSRVMRPIANERLPLWLSAAATLVVLAALLLNRSAWTEVHRDDTLPTNITVITYNIQTGFSRANRWDLEAIAKVIEAQGSDIVILQEVSRGWAIASGVDEAQWLSRRLQMNLAWGPNSHDGLWGVAILSRGKVITSDMVIYSKAKNWRRGVLSAEIATLGGSVYVYTTHLDAADDAGAIRLAQATELIALTSGQSPVIVGGDFNAMPDSDVVLAMTTAGYVDTGVALPAGTGTSSEGKRIDYLFVRDAVAVDSVAVPDVWASDHRPVVARLTLP